MRTILATGHVVHFWSYAVAECDADSTEVATTPGEEARRELLQVHSASYGEQEEAAFFAQMIEAGRLVVRLRVRRLYGLVMPAPPGA